jgi:hypothetical protein
MGFLRAKDPDENSTAGIHQHTERAFGVEFSFYKLPQLVS